MAHTETFFNVKADKVRWDPKDVEIRTRSVEKTLEPLVMQRKADLFAKLFGANSTLDDIGVSSLDVPFQTDQTWGSVVILPRLVTKVTTLVNHQRKSKSGKSKKAHQLAREIDQATERLVKVGEGIALDFPEIKEPMLAACKEAKAAGAELTGSLPQPKEEGDTMRAASGEFSDDPCSSAKRSTMIRAARALLAAVTRLLCIADMADVYRLLATLRMVEHSLNDLVELSGLADLSSFSKDIELEDRRDSLRDSMKGYSDAMDSLAKLTALRQMDLMDQNLKDEMALARATLKKSNRMLLSTIRAYDNHPDVASARLNRDYVMKQISDAINAIAGVAQASGKGEPHPYAEAGELAAALQNLLNMINMRPSDFEEKRTKIEFERQLEEIIGNAARLADSACTRDNTRDRIIAECNNLRAAMQTLVDEFAKAARGVGDPANLSGARGDMEKKTRDLGKQLRKAITDHVSDSFLETNVPLMLLIEAAQSGNEKEVEECAVVFTEHAAKVEEVADLACSMSGNTEGVKMVRIAARQLHSLCPQVINAARTLAARPRSKVAKENMDVFRDAWINQVRVLTEAVDDITTIDDFLMVSEAHILEDVNKCIEALQNTDPETLDRTAGAVRGRVARVDNVVSAEMENYEPGPYTQTVKRAVMTMRENIMPQFAEHVDSAVDALNQDPLGEVDEQAFIDVSRLVYEGVRDIRKAVMMRERADEEDGSDEEDAAKEETLLTSLADEQARQREQAAYEQLQADGKVQFEVYSEGGDDPGVRGESSIVVNGIEYCPKRRGHNVVILDEIGNVVARRTFDTSDPNEGVAMANFLEDIPEEHIALIAIQDTSGPGIKAAEKSLRKLGAEDPVDPGHKSSWAFAGFKGPHHNKPWVTQTSRPRYHGPAMISDMINTPAADQGKVKIEIHSEGIDDPGYGRIVSIKVNGIERSPNKRGFNIVVLDNAGNFLMSKHFDTVDPHVGRLEGRKMAEFLDDLPSERMVCVASLEGVGDGFSEVRDALIRIGADEDCNPGNKGSFGLLGYTGPQKVFWLKQVDKQRGQGPCKIVTFVVTPDAEEKRGQEELIYEEYEPGVQAENDFEDESQKTLSRRSARSLMRALPAEEKAKIAKLTEGLQLEKNRLVTEVSKWDEQGNEIIVLAKKMCMIMMDMSDFTRGSGPLKTTIDVIRAAEKIAKCGKRMTELGQTIIDQCPHSPTRSDLMAYIQRIALYAHQLTITARVKADVQMISGELIVSGLDSATSLIQAAKNLMNAVISTVKASYVASTKNKKSGEAPIVTWKMKAPEKKPLIKLEHTEQRRTIRYTEVDQNVSPMLALSEFDTK